MAHKRFTLKKGQNGFEFANLMRIKFKDYLIPDYSREKSGLYGKADKYDLDGVSVDVIASDPLVMFMIGGTKDIMGKTKRHINQSTGYELINDRNQTRHWRNREWLKK